MPLELRLDYSTDALHLKAAQLLIALIVLLLLDATWFSVSKPIYARVVERQHSAIDVRYGLLAWCALAAGLSAIDRHQTWDRIALSGALLGFVSYATFNGTEAALREDWRSPRLILADVSWGTTACCICALLSTLAIEGISGLGSIED